MSATPEDPGRVRASDADRDRVLESLRQHAAEGRLDVEELAERIDATLHARTLGELRELTSDLPALPGPAPALPRRSWYAQSGLLQMLCVDVLFVVIWLAGGRGSFWPIWGFVLTALFVLRRGRHARGPRLHPRHYDERLPGTGRDGGASPPRLR